MRGIRATFMEGGGDRLVEAVGPEMVDRFSVAGTAEDVRRRLARRVSSADRLWLTVPHHQQSADEMGVWQRSLLRALGR